MGLVEQQEEREVLASIFPEEITDISDDEFRIKVQLDVNPEDSGGNAEEEEPPSFLLNVKYTSDYPDEAPELDILADPDGGPQHAFLDVGQDREHLLASLVATIEENMGLAMVYTLVMALKDTAEHLIGERAQAKRDEHAATIAKAEEEENRKFVGTAVTRESFLAWRAKFQQELADQQRQALEAALAGLDSRRRGAGGKEEAKLTGKQLWERGLAGKLDDDVEEDGMDALEGIDKLKVSAA